MARRTIAIPAIARRSRPGPRLVRFGAAGILALLMIAAAWIGIRTLVQRSFDWMTDRGLALLAVSTSEAAALDTWEAETRADWQRRKLDYVRYLVERRNPNGLTHHHTRLLLSRVSDADYPTVEDWQRWLRAAARLERGEAPAVTSSERLDITELWRAPVGLTSWFSTILPLDGEIFIASLGREFDDPNDPADGVVRVDGASGQATLFFQPPPEHRGPRDVVGLAASSGLLFVACWNGTVYTLDMSGAIRFTTSLGDAIVGPPLAVDTNSDGTMDVVVPTRSGRIVAISGRTGRVSWSTQVAPAMTTASAPAATLARLTATGPGPGNLLVTFPDGHLAVVAAVNGALRGQRALATTTVAGGLGLASERYAGVPGYVADRAGRIWSISEIGNGYDGVPIRVLPLRHDERVLAALRTLTPARAEPGNETPLLLAAISGEFGVGRGAVVALSAEGSRWQCPIPGAIWGTPAVANLRMGRLTGPRPANVVVASIVPGVDAQATGMLTILSDRGHVVWQQALPAPVESSPVVADVTGNNRLEILVADQQGILWCFRTPGGGPVEWGTLGGDSHNTRHVDNAFGFGNRAFGYQAAWKTP
ncbi:MAG: PQQ-binding-like beta-propeller repeat protein [Phycisphaerales bacterium]|nr:PQQ-binding-like beta-propeller repeat protein [Phycisphaerales bacterium]